MQGKLSKNQTQVLRELRNEGYAVIVWSPEELGSTDPDFMQDRSIEFGHSVLEFNGSLQNQSPKLLNFVVLYRIESIMAPGDAPFGFQCHAEDAEHAQEQCTNAYPDCAVVWTWEGEEGIGMQPALDDYYAQGQSGTESDGHPADQSRPFG